jgi:hypothetical protein
LSSSTYRRANWFRYTPLVLGGRKESRVEEMVAGDVAPLNSDESSIIASTASVMESESVDVCREKALARVLTSKEERERAQSSEWNAVERGGGGESAEERAVDGRKKVLNLSHVILSVLLEREEKSSKRDAEDLVLPFVVRKGRKGLFKDDCCCTSENVM